MNAVSLEPPVHSSRRPGAAAAALFAAIALASAQPGLALAQDGAPASTPVAPVKVSTGSQKTELRRVGIDDSRPLTLSLFDAIRMALANNREIEVERINVSQAEYDLFGARGARDVGIGASSAYENRTVPVGSLLAGGPNGSLTTKALTYDFSAQQLLPTGGQWTAQFTNSRVDSNSQFVSLNPQYNTAFSLQMRQPVMRNFRIDDARRRLRIARGRLDLTDAQFRQRAIDVVARVQRSYWDLVFALRDLQIKQDSVDLARIQLEQNRRKVHEGTLAPIELVSVEVEIERRRETVLTALDVVTRSENALKQLVLADREAGEWGHPVQPTDAPDLTPLTLSLDESVSSALSNRPEFALNALQQDINKTELDFFSDQTRPQVDLIGVYASTGLAGTETSTVNPFASTTVLLLDRLNQLSTLAGLPPLPTGSGGELPDFLPGGYTTSLKNLLKNDFRTLRFGVSVSFPLRNRTAEAQLGRALAEGRKIDTQKKLLEQSIHAEVRNAVQSVDIALRRVETSRAAREAAQKQSDSEQRRFLAGLSTTFLVLDRQNVLAEAQGRELRAMTDYNKAVAELQRVMGTTLTSANVEVVAKPAAKKGS